MPAELLSSPYFALVNREGPVRESNIEKFASYSWPMVEALMRLGQVYRQTMMFEKDSIYFYIGTPVSEKVPNGRS